MTWFPHQHRTANDGITFEGEATGGGGGSGVQVVTVPVSSAQILDLFNTPVVLIPGVAGFVAVVNSATFSYLAGLVPYLDGGGGPGVGIVGGTTYVGFTGAGFWDQATDQFASQGFGATDQGATTGRDGANVALTITPASPTLGDGTLLVTLSYFLAPTV